MSAEVAPSQWRHSFVPGLMSYLDASSIITTGISLVLLQHKLGLSPWSIGVLSGTLTGTLAAGAFFGGRLADMWGRRRVFLVNLVGYVVGVGMIVALPSAPVLFAGVSVMGITMGIGLPTSLALIAESARSGAKGKMVGLSSALWMIAILTTLGLATAFAHLGPTGARILFAHLLLVAVLTLVLGLGLHESAEWTRARQAVDGATPSRVPVARLLRGEMLAPLLALTAFYTLVNLAANSIGQFLTLLFVNVAGVDAGRASFLSLLGIPFGVLAAFAFMRVADSRLRRPLFVLGAVVQVVAFAVPAVLGMTQWTLFFMAAAAGAGGGFAGEGIYKVWSQELFPTRYRATAQGFSYGVTRGLTAGFAVVTPAIMAASPAALVWTLAALVGAGALVGALVIQRMGARRGTDPWLDPTPRAIAVPSTPEGASL